MTRTKAALGGVVAGLVGVLVGAGWRARRATPTISGSLQLPGLLDAVEIIRDERGVPHIYAANTHDLFFAQGFVHAQDRLWQMDFQRRVAAGRLSEVLGDTTLELDRWTRILQLRRQAERDLEVASNDGRRILAAYTRGVNRFIETTDGLPIEFALLRYEPEPWTPADCLGWTNVLAFSLSQNWDSEAIRAQIARRVGPERARSFDAGYRDGMPLIVPNARVGAVDGESASSAVLGGRGASNSWVVAGSRTQSGKPVLANDPHLPLRIPGLWYENHLVGGGYNVTGASWPGVPAVLIGHNERIAWGMTASMADVQDLYIERFHAQDPQLYEVNGAWQMAEVRKELIERRGHVTPYIEEVVLTRHGPLVTSLIPGEMQPMALRWTGYEVDAGTIDCMLDLNRAADWQGARRALEGLRAPTVNVIYADVDGNIGYQLAGRIPVRSIGDGRVPVPGWNDEHAWTGYRSLEELPCSYNPPSGYIVSANNKPVGDNHPHALHGNWSPGFRARRIVDRIQAQPKHNVASFQSIQLDQVSLPLQSLARRVAELSIDDPQLRAAQADLAYWDGVMDADSVAASLATMTLRHLRERLLATEIGPLAKYYLGRGFQEALHPVSGMAGAHVEVVLGLLEGANAFWQSGESLDELVVASLRRAVDELKAERGPDMGRWSWGTLNRMAFVHPLGAAGPLKALLNRGPYPMGGDDLTVWPSGHVSGSADLQVHSASYRMIVDLAELGASMSICPPGQSAHLASRHYADQVDAWRGGQLHIMHWDRDAVAAVAEGTLRLQPRLQHDAAEAHATERSLRDRARPLWQRATNLLPGSAPDLPRELDYEAADPEYVYQIYWVNATREWSAARRQSVRDAVAQVVAGPDFVANPTERRYEVGEVGALDGRYSGLSLVALVEVLDTWLEMEA